MESDEEEQKMLESDEARLIYFHVHRLLKRPADGKTKTEQTRTLVLTRKSFYFDRWFQKRTMESLSLCPCCKNDPELELLPFKDRKEKY